MSPAAAMSDSPFLPSDGAPPFESFPIVEDTDARKVIVLSPRGAGEVGWGCVSVLFFPAMFLSVMLVVAMLSGHLADEWLPIAVAWSASIAIPVALIWYSRRWSLSEDSLILERSRITLRNEKFDRQTGESVAVNDETIGIGPGSGITDGSDFHFDAGENIPFVIWGPIDSLAINGLTKVEEVAWLRQEVSDWLRHRVFDKRPAADVFHRPPSSDGVSIRKKSFTKRRRPVRASLLQLPDPSQIDVYCDASDCFGVRIRPGGEYTAGLRWQAFFFDAFITGFSAIILYAERNFRPDGWGIFVGLGVFWMVGLALTLTAIRMSLETLQLELTCECCLIRRTILGWTRQKKIVMGESPAVFLVTNHWEGRRPNPTVQIRGVDGTAEFGTMLNDQEKRWLVMRLRAFWKLDQRTNIFGESEGQSDS